MKVITYSHARNALKAVLDNAASLARAIAQDKAGKAQEHNLRGTDYACAPLQQ